MLINLIKQFVLESPNRARCHQL